MVEDIFKKRRQIRYFSDKVPSEELVNELLYKTYELVPSKQNLMPYKIHVIGPDQKKVKEKLYYLSTKSGSNTTTNYQVNAPYNLVFTMRLAFPNEQVIRSMKKETGTYNKCDPNRYDRPSRRPGVALEVGMFATILGGLCLDNDLDIAYMRCFGTWGKPPEPNPWEILPFIDEYVLLIMNIGYRDPDRLKPPANTRRETKPEFDEIVFYK